MERKIIVKVRLEQYGVTIKTVGADGRKSPRGFYILKSELETLETEGKVLCNDIHCFAQLTLDKKHDRLSMEFYWLTEHCRAAIDGYRQMLTIYWDRFKSFLSQQQGTEYSAYDIGTYRGRPKLTFCNSSNLKKAIANPVIRRRLVKALAGNFNWPYSDEIRLYDDFVPYSFFFQEYQDGKPTGMCGGLILHNADDPRRMPYSIHT